MTIETLSAAPQQSSSLDARLALWAQNTTRLESEVAVLAGTNTYPDWLLKEDWLNFRAIQDRLKEETADPRKISEYFNLYQRRIDSNQIIKGSEAKVDALGSLAYQLGPERLGKAFQVEATTGPLHQRLLEKLRSGMQEGYTRTKLEILRHGYSLPTITDLLGVKDDAFAQDLHSLLLTPKVIGYMQYSDSGLPHPESASIPEIQTAMQQWMSHALTMAVGIPSEEAADYAFSASRLRGEDSSAINTLKLINNFEYFGKERIRAITALTDIHALEAYSIEQLKRMEALVTHPKEEADRLSQHDVTVVMINRFGDYNNAMQTTAADFDDQHNRTLFFEITRMSDIYRKMNSLHTLGIRPSTLILAAHSAPGQFMVADRRDAQANQRHIATIAGNNLVKLANGKTDSGDYSYSLHGLKGMSRLIEDWMQPSRGKDDAEHDSGKKKIVFQACYAAREEEARDVDAEGTRYTLGMESVISQLAQDLVVANIPSSVDIYGAAEGIQIERTGRGIRYTISPASSGEKRQPISAQLVRVENSQITRQQVEEILLRQTT